MPAITDQQIANAAAAAGWTGNDRVIAVAVALAESGGDPTAQHRNANGSTDYGLWQVNSVHGFPVPELLTVVGNGRHAHEVWQRQGWNAWTTYKTGAYTIYTLRALKVAPNASGEVTGSGEGVVVETNPISEAVKYAGKTTHWIADPHNWARVGMVIVGGGLILVGVSVVTRPVVLGAVNSAVSSQVETARAVGRVRNLSADKARLRAKRSA
jgi:hypothetical protein